MLSSILKIVDITKIEDIAPALESLAVIDNDFNGENGEEYLWDVSKNAGYESNATYAANKVIETISKDKNKNDFKSYVDAFVCMWLAGDSYYRDYEVHVKKITGIKKLGGKYAISLAIETE